MKINIPYRRIRGNSNNEDFATEDAVIREAVGILESRLSVHDAFTAPEMVKRYCQLQLAGEKDEHFACIFLDNKHRLLSFERLFQGTIDGASVYPRVVVRRALEVNAAAIILAHNHPSGDPVPSQADRQITQKLSEALFYIDVRVLDHVVVGVEGCCSFAESGYL